MAKTTYLHQLSVNVIRSSVTQDGELVSPTDFTDAKYILAQMDETPVVELSLNNGISVDGYEFVITVPETAITNDMRGTLQHQLILYNSIGQKLPPVFKEKVRIADVIPVT